jgi:hypothetical protein
MCYIDGRKNKYSVFKRPLESEVSTLYVRLMCVDVFVLGFET